MKIVVVLDNLILPQINAVMQFLCTGENET